MKTKLYEQYIKEKKASIFAHRAQGSNHIVVYCVCCSDIVKSFFASLDMWNSNGRETENGVIVYKIPVHMGQFLVGVSMGALAKRWNILVCIQPEDIGLSFDKEQTKTAPKKEISETEKLLNEVVELNNNTPDGEVYDADTILADIFDNLEYMCDDSDLTGFADDVFSIWKESSDKEAVEKMFELFTEVSFKNYLETCKKNITRNNKNEGSSTDDDFSLDAIMDALTTFMPESMAEMIVQNIKRELGENKNKVDDGIIVSTPFGPVCMRKIGADILGGPNPLQMGTRKVYNNPYENVSTVKKEEKKEIPFYHFAVSIPNPKHFAGVKVKLFNSKEMDKALRYIEENPDISLITTNFGAEFTRNEFLKTGGNITCMCKNKTMDLLRNTGECTSECPFGPFALNICGRKCKDCGGIINFTEYGTIYCENCGVIDGCHK